MGSVDVERDEKGRGIKFTARYRVDGKSRKKAFASEKEASKFLASVTVDQATGRFVDPRSGRQTVGEFVEEWMTLKRKWSAPTRDHYAYLWRVHLAPSLSERRLGEVRRSHLQNLLVEREDELAVNTLKAMRTLLGMMFKAAVRDRLIPAPGPSVELEVPEGEGDRLAVALEPDEAEGLIGKVPERHQVMYRLALDTGLRQGEIAGLLVPAVRFLRRELKVATQLRTPASGSAYVTTDLKTPTSYRTIPLPPEVLEPIAHHLERYGPSKDGLVFSNTHGAPMRREAISRLTRKAAAAAGVTATFHSLRHTAASRLLTSELSVPEVAAIMGHSPSVLMTTYAHFQKTNEDRVRTVMARYAANV